MGDVVVFGFGAVGRATVQRLRQQKDCRIRVAQRRRPSDLPDGVTFSQCDLLDSDMVRKTILGGDQVVLAAGFPYLGRVWETAWPRAMVNVLAGCKASQARLVFVDNLYMYGPQHAPLTEDMPLSDHGRKVSARSAVTRLWQQSDVPVAALRASDFYGPGVTQSHLGATGLQALARGKAASLLVPADYPHDFAYVPDVARGVETLLLASDDAYRQAWHLPCAPTRTIRELATQAAAIANVRCRITVAPPAMMAVASLAVPFIRELAEMRFQWDRPHRVNADKWRKRFPMEATPFTDGLAATMASFSQAP